MCVRPVLVSQLVSHAPNGRFTPNIHTWDTHMPYSDLKEIFGKFTKIPKTDQLFGTKRFGRASHTFKNVIRIMPNRDSA